MTPDRLLVELRDIPVHVVFAAFRAHGLQRRVTGFLRARWPVISIRKTTLALGHSEVSEVLDSGDRFLTGPVYAAQFQRFGGSFVLGMDGAEHTREKSMLRAVIRRDDHERISEIVKRTVARELAEATKTGVVDVPALARKASASVTAEYIGVPGPDPLTLVNWAHALFYSSFVNLSRSRTVNSAGVKANSEFAAYLSDLIAARRHSDVRTDTVLDRLIAWRTPEGSLLSDDDIRRNLQHLCDASDQLSVLVTAAVDGILRRPAVADVMRRAYELDHSDIVLAGVLEACRYQPMTPAVTRRAASKTTLGVGASRVREGSNTVAVTISAMFDPLAFPEPDDFRFDRPSDRYFHFGHGPHVCGGLPIDLVLVPEVAAAVIALPGARRGSRISYDGPVPHRFIVRFG